MIPGTATVARRRTWAAYQCSAPGTWPETASSCSSIGLSHGIG